MPTRLFRQRCLDSLWQNRPAFGGRVPRGGAMGGGNPALEIVWGTIPLLVTLFIHGVGMHLVQRQFEVRGVRIYRAGRHGEFFFGAMILAMLATHLIEMLVWAATVNSLEAIPGFRDSFYYVASTYTTLGYGEGSLPHDWRLLGPMIAISGLFAFGWTTGVLVSLVAQSYRERSQGAIERAVRATQDAEARRRHEPPPVTPAAPPAPPSRT
jgi:ion channel